MYIKVKETHKEDSSIIDIDKLNYNFNLLKYGGPIGPQGVQGYPGSTGLQGIQGSQGAQGAQGAHLVLPGHEG